MGAIGRFEGLADFLAVNNEPGIILAVWKVAVEALCAANLFKIGTAHVRQTD